MTAAASPGPDLAQALAADPAINAFVTANAGSGKTKTLIDRVARLLLAGAPAGAILCVTYTKAAAAEMQARLFKVLGDWSVTPDDRLAEALRNLLGERAAQVDLVEARRLFARALETPGGLKIQTIHAFCEQLLRRFPLEAGVSPRFTVMDDAAAALVAEEARELLAGPMIERSPPLADAYARMAVRLDQQAFEGMFAAFAAQREALSAYVEDLGGFQAVPADVWRRCGFAAPGDAAEIEQAAVAATDRGLWRAAAEVLGQGGVNDGKAAASMAAVLAAPQPQLADLLAVFFTRGGAGTPATWVGKTSALKTREDLRERLLAEQERLEAARETLRAARVAEETVTVLTLAFAYGQAYRTAKAARGVLDFTDLTARARDLVAGSPGAPWVLYKLDGGLEHVLIDEAQDTAPEQWAIARALTDEFFTGAGRDRPAGAPHRTVFVVGDEKQSIYSFQGADPDRLKIETDHYIATIRAADRIAELAPLKTSYRSVPRVLGFVDRLFALDRTRAGVRPPEGEAALEHIAFRGDHPGCVDLWPLEEEPESQERDAWDAPLDVESETSANRRLAERIAAEIKRLVTDGERVFDKDAKAWRPARWGDVIILVRRRRALFEDIIRALRKAGAPVAGADRLSLSEHIAFDDLMALARFVRFPADDLTLAALLKSPLCGLEDDDLYPLALRRGRERLWDRLAMSTAPRAMSAHAWLSTALSLADRPPFEFFSRMLGLEDAAGRSGRARMVTRLGSEAADVIEEFLARTLEAEGRGVVDLEGLCDAFAELDISVKREMEGGADEVRVMTAHGAKGLEAPIVFLPETTVASPAKGSPLMADGHGGWLWSTRADDDCKASADARQRRKDREEGESWRLLYVALTRARDRLVLCGRRPARLKADTRPPGWYGAMEETFDILAEAGEVRETEGPQGHVFRRFGEDPVLATPVAATKTDTGAAAPGWVGRPAPAEPAGGWVSPSRAAAQVRGPAPSPLARQGGLDRFRRGDVIHRLLQLLPDVEPGARHEAAQRLLAREADLTAAQRAEMAEAAFGVIDHPDFAEVFGPGSRAEVAMAGSSPDLPAGVGVSGRVDRLVVTPDRALVVDYKTNRPAPPTIEAADPGYIAQMAVYWAVLRAIFPGRRIGAALVWTDGPKLMPVPEKMMAEALAALPGAR
jgi:ATP-dependent helicase/nuclease subunit A